MSDHPDHQSRGHAEFSPSSLKYVAKCPAYKGRDGTSAAAERGTRIHEALEVHDPSALHDEEEVDIYNQIVEMEDAFMANFPAVEEELNEIQVDVDLNTTETWGTCDRFLILKERESAVMGDYKTGISIIDPPENNEQAITYTIGAFQRYPDIKEITFVFYVPLHNATLHHKFSREDLPDLVDRMEKVVREGERVRPQWEDGQPDLDDCNPTQYCRFCKFEDVCPALGGLVIEVAKKLDSTIPDVDPNNIDDPKRLSELFRIAKIVENWASTIKAKTLEAAKEGVELDGLKLRSMGRTRSINDNKKLVDIAADYGIDLETLLGQGKFPLGKLAKLAGSQAPAGEGKFFEQNFVDQLTEEGIISTSDERFTIANQ
jgi:hypothetical protein